MATTASGVTIMGSDPTTTPLTPLQDHFNNLGKSLNGRVIAPVATTTERASTVTARSTDGQAVTTSLPLIVYRADAAAGDEIEISEDGTNWRILRSITDSGWVAVTMATGWTTNSALYVRKVGNVVRFKGYIANNASSIVPSGDNSTVCTLDAAYRPGANFYGAGGGWVSGGAAPEYRAQAVTVLTTGVMNLHANGNQTRIFLDGVSYLTD